MLLFMLSFVLLLLLIKDSLTHTHTHSPPHMIKPRNTQDHFSCSFFFLSLLSQPNLRWLGVHYNQIQGLDCTALSTREITLASNMLSDNKFISTRPRWQNEIRQMRDQKLKCEIEALYPEQDESVNFGREVFGLMSTRGWMD